jgi:transposase
MNIPFKKSPLTFNPALLSPPNIFDLLPNDHECFVCRDIFDQLDTSAIESLYNSKGQHAYHPKLIISILIYSYSRGVFSSREIEQRCHEDISFMYIAQMGYAKATDECQDGTTGIKRHLHQTKSYC